MSENIYRCTPRVAREYAIDALEAGLVPFIRSSPGIGKSSIMKAIAKAFNLEVIDIRLSTCAPEDLSGLPEFFDDKHGQRRARFVPFEMFPLTLDTLPQGKDGWMIFYDEANSATKMVQAATYKVVLDRQIAQATLHERVVQSMAGNLDTDRAITTNLSTAMQSRLVHIEMEASYPEWDEDVALAENYDPRIRAFIGFDQKQLMDFKPDHDEKTFCCPRTWEFMNKLIKGKEVTHEKTGLYAGTITSGTAANFVTFCQLQGELITIKQVLADPTGSPVPDEAQRKWIIVTHLSSQVTENNFGTLCKYINRMDLSFRLLFFRAVMVQHPELRAHPDFAHAMVELAKYLNPKKP